MNRSIVATVLAASLFCASSLALADETARGATPSSSEESLAILRPGDGRVALSIRVTERRSVFVRESLVANAEGTANTSERFRFVCHTPCRLYVRPGAVEVALVGWATNYYHWNVPTHGGAVNLLARRPDGTLGEIPASQQSSAPSEVAQERRRVDGRSVAMNGR